MIPKIDDKVGYIKLVSSEGARVQTVQAVIASGMGPDGDNEARLKKRRRKRKIQLMAAVGVGVLAVAIAFMRLRCDGARSESYGDADECKPRNVVDEVFITQSRDISTGKLNINVHSEGTKQSFEMSLSRTTRTNESPTITLAKISKDFAQVVSSQRKQFAQALQNAFAPFIKKAVREFQAFLSEEANIFLID